VRLIHIGKEIDIIRQSSAMCLKRRRFTSYFFFNFTLFLKIIFCYLFLRNIKNMQHPFDSMRS